MDFIRNEDASKRGENDFQDITSRMLFDVLAKRGTIWFLSLSSSFKGHGIFFNLTLMIF